jgi:hypothetical protein
MGDWLYMQEVQPTWGQPRGDPWVYMQDEFDEDMVRMGTFSCKYIIFFYPQMWTKEKSVIISPHGGAVQCEMVGVSCAWQNYNGS